MPTDEVGRLRCDDCGIEILVAAIVGPDGNPTMTAEEYLDVLHAAGYKPVLQDLHRQSRGGLGNHPLATAS